MLFKNLIPQPKPIVPSYSLRLYGTGYSLGDTAGDYGIAAANVTSRAADANYLIYKMTGSPPTITQVRASSISISGGNQPIRAVAVSTAGSYAYIWGNIGQTVAYPGTFVGVSPLLSYDLNGSGTSYYDNSSTRKPFGGQHSLLKFSPSGAGLAATSRRFVSLVSGNINTTLTTEEFWIAYSQTSMVSSTAQNGAVAKYPGLNSYLMCWLDSTRCLVGFANPSTGTMTYDIYRSTDGVSTTSITAATGLPSTLPTLSHPAKMIYVGSNRFIITYNVGTAITTLYVQWNGTTGFTVLQTATNSGDTSTVSVAWPCYLGGDRLVIAMENVSGGGYYDLTPTAMTPLPKTFAAGAYYAAGHEASGVLVGALIAPSIVGTASPNTGITSTIAIGSAIIP